MLTRRVFFRVNRCRLPVLYGTFLVMTQAEALSILKTGANVFLTGEPGSGKTHTVNQFALYLRDRGVEPSITASTGIAATHLGGYTIHSWSGIGVRPALTRYDLDHIAGNRRVYQRVSLARVLVIDEISMLSDRTFEMAEAVCREIRRDPRPFGGLQVIFVGDFFQLPPVSSGRHSHAEPAPAKAWGGNLDSHGIAAELFDPSRNGKARFAFASPVWQKVNPLVCYLSEQHRQEDPAFLEFLSAVRRGAVEERHRSLLRARYAKAPQAGTLTQLYSHNADVDYINTAELAKLRGSPRVFVMESRGPEPLVLSLKRGCLSPETLSLKIGARVMFTKNDGERRFVNGTTGVVSGFSKESGAPLVAKTGGGEVFAEPMEWSISDQGRVLARIIQTPLRLAWAITVHKSQGMSLDAAHMDLSDAFEYGQGYVALSRVRALRGLTLAGLNARALEVHPDIRTKDGHFRAASEAARQKFQTLPKAELDKMHESFLRAVGGKSEAGKRQNSALSSERGESKERRWQRTAALIYGGKTVAEVAALRGRTTGTVFEHLERLALLGKLSLESITHLKPKRFGEMQKAFADIRARTGETKLTPVRELLGDSYSFDELRLARLFLDPSRG